MSIMQKVNSKKEMLDIICCNPEVVLKFESSHCSGCRILDDQLTKLDPSIPTYSVNIEIVEVPPQWNVRSLPTLLRFESGMIKSSRVGSADVQQLKAFYE